MLTTNEWREALLRRMLAAGDILAVLFGALSLGFLICALSTGGFMAGWKLC